MLFLHSRSQAPGWKVLSGTGILPVRQTGWKPVTLKTAGAEARPTGFPSFKPRFQVQLGSEPKKRWHRLSSLCLDSRGGCPPYPQEAVWTPGNKGGSPRGPAAPTIPARKERLCSGFCLAASSGFYSCRPRSRRNPQANRLRTSGEMPSSPSVEPRPRGEKAGEALLAGNLSGIWTGPHRPKEFSPSGCSTGLTSTTARGTPNPPGPPPAGPANPLTGVFACRAPVGPTSSASPLAGSSRWRATSWKWRTWTPGTAPPSWT